MKQAIKTPIPSLNLRFAEEADIPVIHRFINALAKYEKLSHEAVATKTILKKNLFGCKKYAEIILAEFKGEAVGFALFFHNFSTFLGKPGIYLEDLYVRPEMRGKGFGKTMLTYLAKLAKERECGRLEWSVLNWNKPAISFYESIGARPMGDWSTYRLTGQSLEKLGDTF